ncbi:MAG: NADH-quinone oxidoreductase subunit K [Bacteroidales bacterium]|nr:NADH-quinone oxidoreductase subunit K [Bacteroidales bacterium]
MTNLFSIEYIAIFTSLALLVLGLWGIISQKNIIKIIISFSIVDTSIHLLLVSLAYIRNRTAPIIDSAVDMVNAAEKIVDPVPHALVLTAIVIGIGITALMLSYAFTMYKQNKTLDINQFKSLKW